MNSQTLRVLAVVLLASSVHASPRRAWVAIGDSLTYGYSQGATPYPVRLSTLLGVPVVNMGVGGDVAANINSRLTSHALTFPYKGVIIEECINDLIAGTSGATCFAATEAAVDAALAAGLIVVLATADPCGNYSGWNGTKEAQRDAYNALVRAKAAANPGAVLLLDGDELYSDDGNTIRAACDYGDGLHRNGLCMQVEAEAIAVLIQ